MLGSTGTCRDMANVDSRMSSTARRPVDVAPVELQRLTDAHAGGGQQANHGLVSGRRKPQIVS